MSAQSSRKNSVAKASRASSTSTIDSRDSDRDSHVSLDSAAWDFALAAVNDPQGPKSQRRLSESERVRISVNSAGKVRTKRTTHTAQRNQLSRDNLKKLTNKEPADSGLLRLRHHPNQRHVGSDLTKEELNVYLYSKATELKQVHKKASEGRVALAKNLALKEGTGDRYTIRSRLMGQNADSGLYAAADDDLKLESAVHDISKTAFGAEAGVMRMPLENPDPRFVRKVSDSREYERESDPSGYRWYTGDRCYDVSSSTKTKHHPIKCIKRGQREYVTQETYRADTKLSKFTLNKPEGPGDYYTRYESLRPIPGGSQLEHEDLQMALSLCQFFFKDFANMIASSQELSETLSNPASSQKATFVYFFANWCPDCQAAGPVIDRAFAEDSKSHQDLLRVFVGERSIWKSQDNQFRQVPFSISSIPTLIKMEEGKETARLVESEILDSEQLQQFL